jgi:hypothetical protein
MFTILINDIFNFWDIFLDVYRHQERHDLLNNFKRQVPPLNIKQFFDNFFRKPVSNEPPSACGSIDGYMSDIGPKYITMIHKIDSIGVKIQKDNKWYTKQFKDITLENYEKAIKWRDDKLTELGIPVPNIQMSFDPVSRRYAILTP